MAFLEFKTMLRKMMFQHSAGVSTHTYFRDISTSTVVILLHEMKPRFEPSAMTLGAWLWRCSWQNIVMSNCQKNMLESALIKGTDKCKWIRQFGTCCQLEQVLNSHPYAQIIRPEQIQKKTSKFFTCVLEPFFSILSLQLMCTCILMFRINNW